MNSAALTGILAEAPSCTTRAPSPRVCTIRLAVPRHQGGGQRLPGIVYVSAVTFGLEARDCAERLRRGDRIGLTGRLEQTSTSPPTASRGSTTRS